MRKNSITRTLHQSAPGSQPGSGNEKILDGVRYGVNRQAARVLKDGVHWEPEDNLLERDSADPIPTKPFPVHSFPHDNLAGVRKGRLVVIGLALKGRKWVCRCDCGMYCHRKSKAIRNPLNEVDRCRRCWLKLDQEKKSIFRSRGKHVCYTQLTSTR